MGEIDSSIPPGMVETIGYVGSILSAMVLISIESYYLLFPSLLFLVIYLMFIKFWLKTSGNFLRLDSSSRSFIYSKITATVSGLPIIHAHKNENLMISNFETCLNQHSSAAHCNFVNMTWYLMKILVNSFVNSTMTIFIIVSFVQELTIGSIGLIVTNAFIITASSIFSIFEIGQTEDYLNAVERVFQFSRLKSEEDQETMPDTKQLPSSWPTCGNILIEDVCVSYTRDQMVLKNISLNIKDKEKIGIVGRTGAGKSTLLTAILRWVEAHGKIEIDGISIKDVKLHDLRSRISIILQDPVLFTGTIKSNLDPCNIHSDEELYNALEDVQMLDAVRKFPEELNAPVAYDGSEFSIGQKQLLCIARVILRKNKILLIDEATANIDNRTDTLIQQTIQEKFKDCTILTIAHRLETIMHCDRVLVLDNGQLVEFEEPYNLLFKKRGHFFNLLQSTGKINEGLMFKVAEEARDRRLQKALQKATHEAAK